jgi:integrase
LEAEERWLSHFDTQTTKDRHSNALRRFETCVGQKANELLEIGRKRVNVGQAPEEVEDALLKWHHSLINQGLAPTSAAQWYSVARGYFTANYLRLGRTPRDISVSGATYETTRPLAQKQVRKMIKSLDDPRDKLVVAFLAQTGQRLGVMTALKYPMIRRIQTRGLVEVPPRLTNPHGENVNKAEVRYRFIIGSNTMKLIQQVADKDGWILSLSERQIGRVVDEAAKTVGIQETKETALKRFSHFVHPHVFRRYWKRQMKHGGVKDPDLLNFMMGHKLAYAGAYDSFTDEDLIKAYKRAERQLRIL